MSRLTDCRSAAELRREDSLVILPAIEYYPNDLNNAATSRILVNHTVISIFINNYKFVFLFILC